MKGGGESRNDFTASLSSPRALNDHCRLSAPLTAQATSQKPAMSQAKMFETMSQAIQWRIKSQAITFETMSQAKILETMSQAKTWKQ